MTSRHRRYGCRMGEHRREIETADGTVISYSILGTETPTVVILHGLAGSGREFVPTARALADRRVILIDLRGHGGSSRMPADTSRDAFVDDVIRVIEGECGEQVDLVGQSMGAHTAMLVAAARPDLVRRLVLLETDEGGGEAAEHEEIARFFRSWKVPFATREDATASLGDSPIARAWIADMHVGPQGLFPRFDPEVMRATLEAVAVPRWREWESVTAPTLVAYSDDGMFTEEQKSRFVARGRNARRVDLTGASHDAHLHAFDQWIVALTAFIE